MPSSASTVRKPDRKKKQVQKGVKVSKEPGRKAEDKSVFHIEEIDVVKTERLMTMRT